LKILKKKCFPRCKLPTIGHIYIGFTLKIGTPLNVPRKAFKSQIVSKAGNFWKNASWDVITPQKIGIPYMRKIAKKPSKIAK